MLHYRTVLLPQTGLYFWIHPMALRNTPPQSSASSISDDVVPTMTVHSYPNQKPWITANICIELKARAAAFKERDTNPDTHKKSRYILRRTIKQTKRQYRIKIEAYYTGSDARQMWQGLKTNTDYKGKHRRKLPSDTSLPDELNAFYAHFEASNTETCTRAPAVLDNALGSQCEQNL